MPAPVPAWLPNAISGLRIALVPVWLVWAERCADQLALSTADRAVAIGILAAIGVSDVVDGYLARRFELQSSAGAALDALADKLAQVAVVTWLALRDQAVFTAIPLWFLILLIVRDIILASGWLILRNRLGGVEVVHKWHGKAASVLLFVTMLWSNAGWAADLQHWWFGALGLFIGASTYGYYRDGRRQVA